MGTKGATAKTRKGVAKRFKITANGKIKRQRKGRNHNFGNKNRKRLRRMRDGGFVSEDHADKITKSLPFV